VIHWRAHYGEHDFLPQHQGDHTNTVEDIDRQRLVAFDLWQDDVLLVRVDLRDNDTDSEVERRRLIYRIRHRITERGDRLKVYLVGWQRRIRGRNVQAVNYIFEDGVILLGGQFIENDILPMGAIAPLPHEVDLIAPI
jgi:hypothetical protein